MSYIRQGKCGALGGTAPEHYQWKNGKCIDITNGRAYPGDQKLSNCYFQYGPPPASSGFAAVWDYAKSQLQPAQQTYTGRAGQPSSSFTASGMFLPAVVVVGGVAALLILKKKK